MKNEYSHFFVEVAVFILVIKIIILKKLLKKFDKLSNISSVVKYATYVESLVKIILK